MTRIVRRHTAVTRNAALAAVAGGEPVRSVAARMGISHNTVHTWCAAHGVRVPGAHRAPYKRYSAKQQRDALAAIRGGERIHVVAERMNINYWTVHTWCRRAGVKVPSWRTTPEQRAVALADLAAGVSVRRIALRHNVKARTVHWWIEEERKHQQQGAA